MKFGFRFLMPIVGLAAYSVALPAANLSDKVNFSGQARTRFEWRDNMDVVGVGTTVRGQDTNNVNEWLSRVFLNIDVMPTKSLQVRLTPEFSNSWGAQNTAASSNTNPNFRAYEAWMSWAANDSFTMIVGRQPLALGAGRLIGAADWENSFINDYNLDAVLGVLKHGYGNTYLVYSKVGGGSITGAKDRDWFGIYNALTPGGLKFLKTLDVYALWDDNRATGANRNRRGTLGARFAGDIEAINYDFEAAYRHGKSSAKLKKGVFLDAVVGGKVQKLDIKAEVAYANSEYDRGNTALATPAIDANIADMHAALGKIDFFTARNNIIDLALMLGAELNSKFSVSADGHYFLAASTDAKNVSYTGGIGSVSGKRALGFEGDLALKYAAEKNLDFTFGYDMFKGQDGLKFAAPLAQNKFQQRLYVQGAVSF